MKDQNCNKANESYNNQCIEIKGELKKLNINLKAHNAKQKKEPKNWGYSGDIGYLLGQIKECNQFFNNK